MFDIGWDEMALIAVVSLIVIGPKEEAAGQLSIRSRQRGDEGAVSKDEFIQRIESEIRDRTLTV